MYHNSINNIKQVYYPHLCYVMLLKMDLAYLHSNQKPNKYDISFVSYNLISINPISES